MNNTGTNEAGFAFPSLEYTSPETVEPILYSSTDMGNPLPPNQLKLLEQHKMEQMLKASHKLPKVTGTNGLPLRPLNYMPLATIPQTPDSSIYSSTNTHHRKLLQPLPLALIGATNAEHNRTPTPPHSLKPKEMPRKPKKVIGNRSDSGLQLTINDMDNTPQSPADNRPQNNSLCSRLGDCLGIPSTNRIANDTTAGGKFTKNKRRKLRSSHKKVRAKKSKSNKHKRSSKRHKRYTRKH